MVILPPSHTSNASQLAQKVAEITSSVNLLTQGVTATPQATLSASGGVNNAAQIIPVNTASAAITVTLPPAKAVQNRILYVKDITGNAAANIITVSAQTGEAIDGTLTKTISANYGSMVLWSNGANWFIL